MRGITLITLIIMTSCSLFLSVALSLAQERNATGQEVRNTVQPLAQAIKTGDIPFILSMLNGEVLERSRVLLERNQKYGEFLRSRYEEAEFRITRVEGNLALLEIEFPDGNKSVHEITVSKAANGRVKVTGDRLTRLKRQQR